MPPDSVSPAAVESKTSVLADRRRATIVLVWLALASLTLVVFALMIPLYFDWMLLNAQQPEILDALLDVGFTPDFYATVISVRDAIVTGFFVVTGLALFARQYNDRWVAFVSLTLITVGVSFTPLLRAPAGLPLEQAAFFVTNLGLLFLVLFLLLFPDGHFRPRSSILLAAFFLTLNYSTFIYMAAFGIEPGIFLQLRTWAQIGAIGSGIAVQLYRYLIFHGPVERQQTKWLILGSLTLVVASLAIFLAGSMTDAVTGSGSARVYYTLAVETGFGALPALVLPLSITFSVIQYRLWDLGRVIYSGLLYVILVSVLMAGIFGGAILIQWAFPMVSAVNVPAAVVVAGLIMVLSTPILYHCMRIIADRILFRERKDYRRVVNEFSREIATIIDLSELGRRLVQRVANLFVVSYIGVHLIREDGNLTRLDEKSLRDRMRFHTLSQKDLNQLGGGEEVRLLEGGVMYLLLPILTVQERDHELVGILTVGPRISGQGFSTEDREILFSLASQVGTAIYVADLVEAITEAERELKAAADTATLYLDLLTHDTRNQLQAILLASEAIQQENPSLHTRALLNNIVEAVKACESLISKAQVTESFLSTELSVVPLDNVIEKALAKLGQTYADIEVDVENHIPGTMVFADRHLLHMLMNILENAVVHNHSYPRKVWVVLGKSEGGVMITIADNGPGISDGKKEGLFDPDRRFGGVGVHQAQRICQKYGGRVSVADRIPGDSGRGAEFSVWLPLAESHV